MHEEEITSKKGLYIFPPLLSGINFAILLLVGILFMRKEMNCLDYFSVAFGGLLTVVFMVSLFLTHRIEQMRMPPEDVDKLITEGPYRIVRHPNFAGFICMNIAYLFFFRTLWLIPMICVFIVLWYYEARHEERILISKFGDKYKQYRDYTGMFFPKRNILKEL
jgi:protein-S-isoprenylcysteine O-methyltransferase Ste14